MILVSAVCAALSAWFFLRQNRNARVRALAIAGEQLLNEKGSPHSSKNSLSDTHTFILGGAGAGLLGWTFGDFLGAVLGVGLAVWFLKIRRARQLQPQHNHMDALARDTPVVVDLLCATLVSGATIRDSLVVVGTAMAGSPTSEILQRVVAATDLGADPREAWAEWAHDPIVGRLAESLVRSHQTGSGLVEVLEGVARELRREHKRRVETAARSAGVKAVLPLAACFLPAFFALGVVPIVASLASSTDFLGM